MKSKNKTLVISALMLSLSFGNYIRLSDTECIKSIHVISILVMGASLGILLQELIQRIQQKNK